MNSDGYYLITGIQAGKEGNKIPIRREIDEWWFSDAPNDANQRSLFVHALSSLQSQGLDADSTDKEVDLSYFGIAGIHGSPIRPWPYAKGPQESKNTYCAHQRITFGTWHTPYMLLYEQRIYEEMTTLISTKYDASIREEMTRAADTWRLPFWDWAMKKPTWNVENPRHPNNQKAGIGPNCPFVITQPKVEVRNFDGTPTSRSNPLFRFSLKPRQTFNQLGVDSFADFAQRRSYQDIRAALQGSVYQKDESKRYIYFANSLPDAVYRLMRTADHAGEPAMPYNTFVTQQWHAKQEVEYYPSLESIHNNVHGFIAGPGGFMGNTSTAAFDPIFWLHHCNIDRLLSIWQVLYSKAYQTWLDSGRPGDRDGPNTELRPFRGADGKFFTSKTCSTKFKEFGYTYPELQEWNYSNRNAYLNSINTSLDQLYSTTSKAALLLKNNEETMQVQMSAMTVANLQTEHFPRALMEKVTVEPLPAPLAAPAPEAFGKPEDRSWSNIDYVVNVVYERFALGGEPYAVTIFLGDVPQGTGNFDFQNDITAVSVVYNFSSPSELIGVDEEGCANCKEKQATRDLSSGQCIITDYLIERIKNQREDRGLALRSLEKTEVVPYLQKNLHWRISDDNGNLIPKEDPRMSLLKVSVATATATHFSNPAKYSQYTPYVTLWDVTSGRRTGAADGDI